jgi:hypothetical protein
MTDSKCSEDMDIRNQSCRPISWKVNEGDSWLHQVPILCRTDFPIDHHSWYRPAYAEFGMIPILRTQSLVYCDQVWLTMANYKP